MIDRDVKMNGTGVSEEPMYSLNTVDRHGVLCLNDQGGSVMGVSEDVVGSLRAQEHGHQPVICFEPRSPDGVPRICERGVAPTLNTAQGGQRQPCVAVGNGQLNQISMAEQANTLDTMHDQQMIMVPDIAHALRAKANLAFREDAETYPAQNNHVRRLTPLECERLQGYPDGWTDIGEWVDSKGKKHKESSDTARYKALGNSIALPFWFYLLRRISAQYERPATLGSLFDGIGGFPLCWERCNGKGTALWASEIEEFPMAVTKARFK